jgi:hypothetical protein
LFGIRPPHYLGDWTNCKALAVFIRSHRLPEDVNKRAAQPKVGMEGVPMSRILAAMAVVLMSGTQALANVEAGKPADYSGISGLYYTLIGLILAYGVYDTFFKKS